MSIASNVPTTSLPLTDSGFTQTVDTLERQILASLASAQTATIQAFYPESQTADVLINSVISVGSQTTPGGQLVPILKTWPVFPAVPVVFLGGGGSALTFPVAKGDTCLLVFLDRDMSNWWTTGQTNLPPNTDRLHDFSDAVAVVGLRSSKGVLASFSTTDAQFYGPSGPNGPILSMGSTQIGMSVGSNSLRTLGDALFNILETWTNSDGTTASTATKAAVTTLKTAWDLTFK